MSKRCNWFIQSRYPEGAPAKQAIEDEIRRKLRLLMGGVGLPIAQAFITAWGTHSSRLRSEPDRCFPILD